MLLNVKYRADELTAPIPEPPPVITTILPLAFKSGLSGRKLFGTVRCIFFVSWKGRVYVNAGSDLSKDMMAWSVCARVKWSFHKSTR